MRQLTENEEKAFRDAVTGWAYDRDKFEKAVRVIRYGKALAPVGIEYESSEWPRYIREWRGRKEWAIGLLERHQAASKAAHEEYWHVFMAISKPGVFDKTDVLMELTACGRVDLCQWAHENLVDKNKHDNT